MALGLVLGALALPARGAEAQRQSSATRRELPKPFEKFLGDSAISRMRTGPLLVPASGDSVVATARTQLGTRYRLGASTPGKAFDCSGFVRWVMAAFDVPLPRTSHEQARAGIELPRDTSALRPGDLLTFGTKHRISHVGIYVGEGRYIHASSVRRGVIESSLDRDAARGWWRGARRLLASDSTDALLGPSGD